MKLHTTIAITAAAAIASLAEANTISLTLSQGASEGGQYSASVTFSFSTLGNGSTQLDVQLQNLSSGAYAPGNSELSGVFFDITGSPTMTYTGLGTAGTDGASYNDLITEDVVSQSAAGTVYGNYSPQTGEEIDDYWFLEDDASADLASVGGQQYALHSAGFFGLGGSEVLGGSPDFGTPNGPDGGILSVDPNATAPPNGFGNQTPFTAGGVWFSFNLGDYDFSSAIIDNIWFQFGTDSAQPGFSQATVPLPPAAWAGGIGLIAAGVMRRRIAS